MTPADEYRKAREDGVDCVVIQGKPYLPNLFVDASDVTSIRHAVAIILNMQDVVDTEKYSWTVTTISGGITNKLYRVSNVPITNSTTTTSTTTSSVLVRIFGAHGLIDRDDETATFAALASQHISPPYFGRFQNGRIEGWCDDMRPLETPDLKQPGIRRTIAVQLAKLHVQFQPTNTSSDADTTPGMWKDLYNWCRQAATATFGSDHDTERANQHLELSTYANELQWLHGCLPHTAAIAFCHNDVLAANVLYNDASHAIQLIDFEYGCANYIGFDIANHMNEHAGGPPTTSVPNYDELPSREDQLDFIKAYLEATKLYRNETANNNHETTTAVTQDSTIADDNDAELFVLYDHVQYFMLANHMYWGLWAINQAASEGCREYDYLLYAMQRMKQYRACKNKSDCVRAAVEINNNNNCDCLTYDNYYDKSRLNS
jgi:ethanolamine kinase